MARTVHVVPHTHWDREWYLPYPVFRMRLVELLDTLIPTLDADPAYAHFQLDGQMAVVDDYLEVRPERRERLVELAQEGRITMGPWYTLPDEFLVSGETLVRNLQLGLARAETFGGAMEIGYLPDMFGHVAQMPQILRSFGFADAVVWRGIPRAITTPAFDWAAPDGSTVRAEYLCDGYSNGARLPEHGKDLVEQVEAFRIAQGSKVGDDVLWMNGTDHQLPKARLGRVVHEANEAQNADQFVVTSLADHLSAAPRDGLPRWQGELRSGARTNVLMGVASCRVDVKQAAALAECSLERVAEPLSTCWLQASDWPGNFLDGAWLDVIRNAAHDSICGCSADEVNQAVLHRFREATLVAGALTDRALVRALAASGQPAIAVNPTSRPRATTATVILVGDVAPSHTQQVGVRPARTRTASLTAREAEPVVMRAAVEDPRASAASLAPADDGSGDWIATVTVDRAPSRVDSRTLRAQLRDLARDASVETVHVELVRSSPTQEVLLRTGQIPGFGWRGLAPTELGDHAVRSDGLGLANGLVSVVVDPGDGTFAVDGTPGFGRLVDDGDSGDTYNWNPPRHGAHPVEAPLDVAVSVLEAGPVRGRIEIARTYAWPTAVVDDRRVGHVDVVVTTTVELHAGEDLVRVSVAFDNPSADHRLRVHLPLPRPAATSVAECAFGTVERPLVAEGGPTEVGLPTFPSRRFVSAGGLTVAHDGLSEYELVDIRDEVPVEGDDGKIEGNEGDNDTARAHELAITLIRCVGIISQGPMAMRPVEAGPPTLTPAAQMPGHHEARFVLHVGDRDPYAVADESFTPLPTAHLPGARRFGDPTASGQALAVSGAEVTALRRTADGRVELRIVNPTPETAVLSVPGRTGEVVDLRHRPAGIRFDGHLELGAWKIATLLLDD
jgi:mannosylglycerate hydrolase